MNLFREFQKACELSPRCVKMGNDVDNPKFKNCVYECTSPTCFREIYEFDEVCLIKFCSFRG